MLSLKCDKVDPRRRPDYFHTFCGNSVNIDWWWAGDTALADAFGETFEQILDASVTGAEELKAHKGSVVQLMKYQHDMTLKMAGDNDLEEELSQRPKAARTYGRTNLKQYK